MENGAEAWEDRDLMVNFFKELDTQVMEHIEFFNLEKRELNKRRQMFEVGNANH